MEKVKHKCCKTVASGGWMRVHQCSKGAKYEYEGKHYCGAHHPPAVRAKQDARRAKWDAEIKQKAELRKEAMKRDDEQNHRADCYPVLLDALKRLHGRVSIDKDAKNWFLEEQAIARAAIAKAEGGAL